MNNTPKESTTALTTPRVENGLIRVHGYMALIMVVISALFGIAVSMKFNWPEFLGGSSVMTWGRLRYCHTQGIFFGWLGNAFLAFLYYSVPRLAMKPVSNRSLGWLMFIVWNFVMVIPGWMLMMHGFSQPLEWAEFPIIVDIVVITCFVLLNLQFVVPFLRGKLSDLYVTGWYFLGAITFTTLAYPVGNLVPEFVPGARGASYSGLWIHDSIGLWVTPLAVGIAYFVIPAATGRPIYSHFLSMIGFWLLFFVYPLNGTHHYIFSSIPMEAQMGAIVASVYLGMDVILVVTNQLLSLRGSAGKVAANVALRFIWTGIVIYLIVSLQGAAQALMPVNKLVHFTDWVIAHSHLALLGFASFVAIGGMLHVWKNTPGVRYSPRAANWSFWLLSIGLFLMFVDLTIGGLVQGQLWDSSATWMESVNASRIFWMTRTLSSIPVLAGFICLCMAMTTGERVGVTQAKDTSDELNEAASFVQPVELAPDEAGKFAWLGSVYVLTGVAGIGCFAMSFLVLAVWPNQELARTIAQTKPHFAVPMTESELRGRAIYAREGCAYCHTQMVRSTEFDTRRFGPVSRAWETEDEYPQMWGTRRVGPDLARETRRRPTDWQLTHLYNPRYVVPESMMPGYQWLFNGSPDSPTEDALNLVAYLESLGRNGVLAGLGRSRLESTSTIELTTGEVITAGNAHTGGFDESLIPMDRGPAPMLAGKWSERERASLANDGHKLFIANCSGCHSDCGCSVAPGAASLFPKPKDLTVVMLSDALLSDVLWNGVEGSSMPAWHELPFSDLRALAAFVNQISKPKYRSPQQLSADEIIAARKLYTTHCALCHGEKGRGDGISAAALAPRPTSFYDELPTLKYAADVIKSGIPGTAMVHWNDKLTEAEQALLVRYVRSFYQSDKTNDEAVDVAQITQDRAKVLKNKSQQEDSE